MAKPIRSCTRRRSDNARDLLFSLECQLQVRTQRGARATQPPSRPGEKSMANRAGVAGGHEEVLHGKGYGLHVTRRAFREFAARGLATVGLGGIGVARG